MMNWYKEGNFDRITAFSHALVYARELDKLHITPDTKKKTGPRVFSKKEQQIRSKLLGNNRYGMSKGKRY